MKSWLTALSAAVFVLVGTGCGNECTDRADCAEKGDLPADQEYACVENKCVAQSRCSPACGDNQFCDVSSGQFVCRTCTAERGCFEGYTCDPAFAEGTGVCLAHPPTTSAQIASFLDTNAGALEFPQPIEGAYVTYIKPPATDGGTETGFFLQAEPEGPAMFVADTTALASVTVGDRVNLMVTAKKLITGVRAAETVTDLTKLSKNHPVQNLATDTTPGLRADRTEAADLVSNLAGYEGELMSLTGTVAPAPINSNAGGGHTSIQITTTGIPAPSTDFRLRMPTTLFNQMDLSTGCTFTLMGPMWRFNSQAQPSVYSSSDITVTSCPAPTVVSAAPPTTTTVRVTFNRPIDPASITDAATQFTFDNGLTTTVATVNGTQVVLTTNAQTPGTTYTLTVANTVKDIRGAAVATPNTAQFTSVRTLAVWGARLRILGTGFTDATSVKVGDVNQTGFTVDSDTQITVPTVSTDTPLGASQPIVVTTPAGDVDAGTVPVLRLLINEVDTDTAGTDVDEFIEIDTGVPDLDLLGSGFSIVFINGFDEKSYGAAIELKATTNADGLLLLGNVGTTKFTPAQTFPNSAIQNGPDAVAIYQGPEAAFPAGTLATTPGLIDAVVYGSTKDDLLLEAMFGSSTGLEAVTVNEAKNLKATTESIQRCGSLARRDGRVFSQVGTPSPGAPNTCP